jgi:hypothetical protein
MILQSHNLLTFCISCKPDSCIDKLAKPDIVTKTLSFLVSQLKRQKEVLVNIKFEKVVIYRNLKATPDFSTKPDLSEIELFKCIPGYQLLI